jgi:hypothetical protein
MAFARSAVAPRNLSFPQATTAPAKSGGRVWPGFWQRFYASIVDSRQQQVDREIALYLRSVGNKFTDEAEREIERRFLGPTRW